MAQASASSIRSVPLTVPVEGMTFWAPPACTLPHTSAAPARGSSRRDSAAGTLGDHLGQGEGEVLGQVRPGGVPAAAGEGDGDRVGGGGDGALAQADAGRRRRLGSQWTREDAVDAVEAAVGDDLVRAAGDDLLGRLEDQPHRRARGRARRPRGPRAPARRPAARAMWTSCPQAWQMPSVDRGPRQAGAVQHRQRVEVGAQRHAVRRVRRPEVGDQARAGQRADADAGGVEPAGDERGGAGLGAGQLGVGVQVPVHLHQLRRQPVDGRGAGRR